MKTALFRARMPVPREQLDLLMDLLAILEPPPTAWEDVESGVAWIETFDPDRRTLEERARAMADLAGSVDGRVHAAQIDQLQPQDWTESWKRFFHATRISERVVVAPPWEDWPAAPDDLVVRIDPGLSFGTGLHPTTRTCLQLLDRLALAGHDFAGQRLLDLGCGSGILAIAAAGFGCREVVALDYDPVAVKATGENILLNGCDLQIFTVARADVLQDDLPQAGIVVANILASVLIEAAPRIAGALWQSPDSALILSGILESQFPQVTAAFAAEGLKLAESLTEAEWQTGLFRYT